MDDIIDGNSDGNTTIEVDETKNKAPSVPPAQEPVATEGAEEEIIAGAPDLTDEAGEEELKEQPTTPQNDQHHEEMDPAPVPAAPAILPLISSRGPKTCAERPA